MSTDRQIEANRENARKSTGPATEAGKAASRRNAIKHGLTGESADVGTPMRELFEDRRDAWARELRPQTEGARSALDRAVAASIRIEQSEIALNALTVEQMAQARLTWDDDRRVEAATLLGRLAKDPMLVSAQLATTRHGTELMIETWNRLGEALSARGDWSDHDRSVALDLLGTPADLREGQTRLDPPRGIDPGEWLRELASGEIDRLDRRRAEGLDELRRDPTSAVRGRDAGRPEQARRVDPPVRARGMEALPRVDEDCQRDGDGRRRGFTPPRRGRGPDAEGPAPPRRPRRASPNGVRSMSRSSRKRCWTGPASWPRAGSSARRPRTRRRSSPR